jgi:hypothetical protein
MGSGPDFISQEKFGPDPGFSRVSTRATAGDCPKKKALPEQGFFSSEWGYGRRVPITSISTRRFFMRPSFVLLLATGCFSPLPSV